MNIAFIGLGVMGYPMAGHLQQGGHDLCVYNRTNQNAVQWARDYGGAWAATPREASMSADIVCICVGDDSDVRSVVLGESGVLAGIGPDTLIVDHTTASATLAKELEAIASQQSVGFLDAPVSGGQAGAENAALTIMVGGSRDAFSRAEKVLALYARCVRLMGPSGSGQLAKMVNQICIAGIVQGLAEGMAFSEAAGLDTASVVEVISQGAAQSWQMDNRYRTMLAGEYEHGFAVDWMRKDLAMVLQVAAELGLELPVASAVDQFYSEVQSMGGGRWDTSSLFARMTRQVSEL